MVKLAMTATIASVTATSNAVNPESRRMDKTLPL
jgi:hypothetical protein